MSDTPETDLDAQFESWMMKHMTKKGRSASQIQGLLDSGCGVLSFESFEAGFLSASKQVSKLERQRNELLEALEHACAYPLTGDWFEKAQTAIAKAKGQTP